MLDIIKNNKNIKNSLQIFGDAISGKKVRTPQKVPTIVFLCGANIDDTAISARRSALLDFAKLQLPHTQFFLAESIIFNLQNEEKKLNLLDFEARLSKFADKIIILLESASTFAELGAFCHERLRSKLIVINDSKFKNSNSFINLGPLKAIEEASGPNSIINYNMNSDGINQLDSIGDIYSSLYELLREPGKLRYSSISKDSCNPSKKFDKYSVMMMHDLVYLCGPMLHLELVEVLKLIFGSQNFKISEHMAFLQSTDSITRTNNSLYKSKLGKPFYQYKFDINRLISVFRNYMLKFHPERMYGH